MTGQRQAELDNAVEAIGRDAEGGRFTGDLGPDRCVSACSSGTSDFDAHQVSTTHVRVTMIA